MVSVKPSEDFSGADEVNAALDLILKSNKKKKAFLVAIGYVYGFIGLAALGFMLHSTLKHVHTGNKINKLVQAVERVRYADEALTMSARMAACSGDMAWFDRYDTFLGPIDEAIANSVELYPEGAEEFLGSTSVSNDALVVMEIQVFDLVSRGASDDIVLANNIMSSDDYANNKTLLNSGLEQLVQQVENQLEAFEAQSIEQTWMSQAVISCAIVFTFINQVYIVRNTAIQSSSERQVLFTAVVNGFKEERKRCKAQQ